jgi:hypothetical protein
MEPPWSPHGATMEHHGATMEHYGATMEPPWSHHGATMEPLWSPHGGLRGQNFSLLYQGTLGRKMVYMDPRDPYWLVLEMF